MYERALQLGPEDFESWGALGDACRFSGGHAERARQAYSKAIELAQSVLRVNPSDANATVLLAHYYANIDESERAKELLVEALKRAPRDMYTFYNTAVTNVRLGETEQALTAIEQAVDLGYPVVLLGLDAGLMPLRESDRFTALLAKREDGASVRQ
jgi:tetratricopeptide (TPR) repeat protein